MEMAVTGMRTTMVIVAAFVLTVVGANWAVSTYGIVPVGFGYSAPAGVLFAGLALTLRDVLHERPCGPWWVLGAIVAGAGLSFALEGGQRLAVASATAFAVGELADFAVYAPLRRRSRVLALAASNAVGLVVDSVLFLAVAFGSQEFLAGQVLAKGYMTVVAVAVLAAWRTRARIAAVEQQEAQR